MGIIYNPGSNDNQQTLNDLKPVKRGKVRDVYDLDDKHFLMVASDRISCFDHILPTAIPNKGKVLNQLSTLWFNFSRVLVPNHFVTNDLTKFESLKKYNDLFCGRSMVVKKARPIPVECVVRGYLVGSGWKEYQESGAVCGIKLPDGLRESDKLDEPIFTPARKADTGHDENIDFESAQKLIGNNQLVQRMKDISIQLYKGARIYAYIRGIIIADTKFEFGLVNNELVLIDEVLTPDSSRFWPKKEYAPGQSQPSFDKQFVRDYLETVDWNKEPPAPQLPQEIVSQTEQKYRHALKLLSGKDLAE